jgi:hypothetical protein
MSDEAITNEFRQTKTPSLRLAWAITFGEGILFGGLVWFFADYWMMLPVPYRVVGLVGLTGLGALGVIRIVRLYWRARQLKRR